MVLVSFAIGAYNKLIKLKEMTQNAKAQIATQIQSRWDALSNLISAISKYSEHEKDTLKEIVESRSRVSRESTAGELEQAEDNFQQSFSKLIAISESYPELKASSVYENTMRSVNGYEKNVRLSRMTYNDTVTKYNRLIKTIPTNIVANIAGLESEVYFEAESNKTEMPEW